MLHSVRGIRSADPAYPGVSGIYLNEELGGDELELVAAHELCHILADDQGFGYRYGLTGKMSEHQLNLREILAISICCCFVHLIVDKLMQESGFSICDLDKYIVNEIKEHLSAGRKIGTVAVAQNAVLHISAIYHKRFSLSTLDLNALEDLYGHWDQRILDLSHKVQQAIPNVDVFSVNGCYEATIAARDAVGLNLGVNLSSEMHIWR